MLFWHVHITLLFTIKCGYLDFGRETCFKLNLWEIKVFSFGPAMQCGQKSSEILNILKLESKRYAVFKLINDFFLNICKKNKKSNINIF